MLLKWWEGLVALVILKATCWSGFWVKGKTPGRPSGWGGGGNGRLDNSLTLLPCMLTGKTTKTNLQNRPKRS